MVLSIPSSRFSIMNLTRTMKREDYLPISHPPLKALRRAINKSRPSSLSLILLALLAGTFIGSSISLLNFYSDKIIALHGIDALGPDENGSMPVFSSVRNTSLIVADTQATSYVTPEPELTGLELLKDMVLQTKGYWTRDYSLHLGWNNVSSQSLFLEWLFTRLRCDILLKPHYYMVHFSTVPLSFHPSFMHDHASLTCKLLLFNVTIHRN